MTRYFFPATSERVKLHTKEKVNNKIKRISFENMQYYNRRSTEHISQRIEELNHEWDTERALETNSSLIIIACVLLGLITRNTFWFVLTGIIGVFLLQHAIQGWCPILPLFRRIGVRTQAEIDEEKFYLKNLRGDYKNIYKDK